MGVVGRRVVGLGGWTLRFGRSVAIAVAVYDQLLGNIFLASSLLGSTGIASATGWPGRHRGRDVSLLLLLVGCSRLPIWFGQLLIMVTIPMPFRDSRHPAGSNGFDVFAGSEQSRHLKFFCSFEYSSQFLFQKVSLVFVVADQNTTTTTYRFWHINLSLIDVLDEVSELLGRALVNDNADKVLLKRSTTGRQFDAEDLTFEVRRSGTKDELVRIKVFTLDDDVDVKKLFVLKRFKTKLKHHRLKKERKESNLEEEAEGVIDVTSMVLFGKSKDFRLWIHFSLNIPRLGRHVEMGKHGGWRRMRNQTRAISGSFPFFPFS